MTDQPLVQIDVSSRVAVLTLNRPDSRNALSRIMRTAIISALQQLSQDPEVQVIVLTGAGKAFCAGLDLKELQSDSTPVQPEGLGVDSPVVRAFRDCPQPILGAINGFAVTGGFELALACDFLYAAEAAQFADTHALVGILPGWGLSRKLPRLVGINRAREISFTGRFFSAEEACAWGLVNRVIPDEQLMTEALNTARRMADMNPDALYHIRAMMNSVWEMSLRDALAMEGETAGEYNSALDFGEMEQRLRERQARSRH